MSDAEAAAERLALVLAYDGTEFAGWQIQPGVPTVQGALRQVLATIHDVAPESMIVAGAGRTDAGVHALGQVAAYLPPTPRSVDELNHALDRLLPESIRVLSIVRVAADFDPRRACVEKRYAYRIVTAPTLLPFDAPFAWHVRAPIDLDAMRAAASVLTGKHDFSTFAASGSPRESHVRQLRELRVVLPREGELRVELAADGFLYKMARNLVGYLVDVGFGRDVPPPQVALEAKDRGAIGKTAPARGLCLVAALYPGRRGATPVRLDRLRDGPPGW